MIIRILIIFLITFTSINTTPCPDNPTCDCPSSDPDEIKIVCNIDNETGFTVNIKSMNKIQIICKSWKSWEHFHPKGRLSGKILESLSFEYCGVSNEVRLKDVVRQFGVEGTHTLIFKSHKNLFATLKGKYLQGFSDVKSLILSHNSLLNISNHLLWNFPELEYIDLSYNNFDLPVDIFNVNPKLEKIIIQKSGMGIIHAGTFNKLPNLELLDIMSNYLEEIKPDTFDQLVSLKSLNLANNLLSDLPWNIFQGLENLERLNISINNFSSIPSRLFDQNKKLKELYLQSNIKTLDTLPDNLLANLTMLSEVHLNSNGFTFLPESLFWGSSPLDYISLNKNSLVTLPKNIFLGLRKAKKLSLKDNKINTLPDKIFEDMKELETLDLSNNLLIGVSSDLFYGLDSLHELNMERNKLHVIQRKAFCNLHNLTLARFSHNPLKLPFVKEKLSVFYNNQYLQELYLSNCSIDNFFDDWTSGNNNLRLLDLNHNFINNITIASLIVPSLDISIDLSYNKIRNIHFDQIKEIISLHKGNRTVDINLEHNPLFCKCPLYNLLRYREGKMSPSVYNLFHIKTENLTCVQPDGTNEIEISQLNTSNYDCLEDEYFKTKKNCQYNCTCRIKPSDRTRIVDCSYKMLYEFLFDKEKVIIKNYNSYILNLTGNLLTEMPSNKTYSLIKVTGLLLSNNRISAITHYDLPNTLKLLELQNNYISTINSEVMNYLESMSWEKLTLSGNPIKCNCDNLRLYYFVRSHRINYKDLDKLLCEDTKLPMHKSIRMEKVCVSYLVYFITAVLLIALILIIPTIIYYCKENIKKLLLGDINIYRINCTPRSQPAN